MNVKSPVQSPAAAPVRQTAEIQAPVKPAAATAPTATGAPKSDGFAATPRAQAAIPSGTQVSRSAPASALWGAEAADPTSPMPASELSRSPMTRHLDYFDANHDGVIKVKELYNGLRDIGLSPMHAMSMAVGTGLVRGSLTMGRPSLDLNIENAMKSAQSGRSHVFADDGSVDTAKLEEFVGQLDPKGGDRITMDDFKRVGKQIAQSQDPGTKLTDAAKRKFMAGEFDLAWKSLMQVAGHTGADGQQSLTRDDIRHFFDGSLFYRLAAAHAQQS